MSEYGGAARGKLLLTLDHGVIESVDGDRSLLPSDMSEPEGMSLFELVHPVDRERVRYWLGELPGISPVFRRAQAEEPARWFELVAAERPVGERVRMLLVEATSRVRERDLIRRVMAILARFDGEELLERIPAMAMEATNASGALLVDIHGPLAVVRMTAGEVGVPEGAALTVAGSPLEAVVGVVGSRVYEDGLAERFPTSALVQAAGASSAAAVPVRFPEHEEAAAALVVLADEPHRFSDGEREVLETLAARAGLELRKISGADAVPVGTGSARFTFASGPAVEGALNAFGNLLAAIGLNCELLLSEEDLPPATLRRLERIAATVAQGGKLLHLIGILSAPAEGTAAPGRVDVVLRELADLLPLCDEGLEMKVNSGEDVETVWASEQVLYLVLSTLVLAAAKARGGGLTVEARLMGRESWNGSGRVGVELRVTPRRGSPPRRSWDPLPEAMEAVRRLLDRVGGAIDLEVRGSGLRIVVGLVEIRAEESGPHQRVE